MDTLQIAYKILYALEHDDNAEYKGQLISPEKLGVSDGKWLEVMETLQEEQYISGLIVGKNILGNTRVDISRVKITLKGAEYLRENSTMRKIARIATDVIEIIK